MTDTQDMLAVAGGLTRVDLPDMHAAVLATEQATVSPGADTGVANERQKRQVIACLSFGWKLEELVGFCATAGGTGIPATSTFPADFPRTDLQHLQALIQELSTLAPAILPADESASNPSSPPGMVTSDLAALVTAVQNWVAASPTPDRTPIVNAVATLDGAVAATLIGLGSDSLYEAAYEVGKALSLTYWTVASAAAPGAPVSESTTSTAVWAHTFSAGRLASMTRRLQQLSPVLGADSVSSVAYSLEYWRNALLTLPTLAGSGPRAAPLAGVGAAALSSDSALERSVASRIDLLPELILALRQQTENWYDVLTGNRALDVFNPVNVLAYIAEEALSKTGSRLKPLIPMAVGLTVTIGIFGALVAVGILVLHRNTLDTSGSAVTTILTVVSGAVTYFVAHFSLLYQRGQRAIQQVEVSGQQVLSTASQATQEVAKVVGQSGPVASHLVQLTFQNIVRQLQLEEYTIGMSQPLVQLVLRSAGKGSASPLEETTAFLRLVYGGRSNFERLLAIFPELYAASAIAV